MGGGWWWWWWWAKPLQTLSQGLVLTLRSLLALSLTTNILVFKLLKGKRARKDTTDDYNVLFNVVKNINNVSLFP